MADQRRKQIRLLHYDYGNAGLYYVTICTHDRKRFLSRIVGSEIQLTPYGEIVEQELQRTSEIHQHTEVFDYVIMPNHIHFVLLIENPIPRGLPKGPSTLRGFHETQIGSMPIIVRNFKAAVTSRIRKTANLLDAKIWQRGFYEHVIRNEKDLTRIREYIQNNPLLWHLDAENPSRVIEEETHQP
jgi:putative transposase